MKITDSEVIRSGEQELIEGIIADLDWGAVDAVIKEKHGLELEEDVEFRKGDLVVLENKIAYKLDFQVKLNISILLDREGNYLGLETTSKKAEQEEKADLNKPPEHGLTQENDDAGEGVPDSAQ